MTNSSYFTLADERSEDAGSIENLLDLAFGSDRFSKSSYLLRHNVSPVPTLGLTLRRGSCVCGTVRFWPVKIGENSEALLLGPLGVHPDHQGYKGGQILMKAGLDKARDEGHRLVFLVGDLDYYSRAGFARVPEGQIIMPGRHEPERLLYTELVPGAMKNVMGLLKRGHA